MSLHGHRALITGGSRGIGRGIAQRLASQGTSTIIVSRSAARLEDARKALPSAHEAQSHHIIAASVADSDFWEGFAKDKQYKDVSILVNAAGVAQNSLLFRTAPEDINEILETNLMGAIFASRAVARNMVKNKNGCIINISSVLGLHLQLPGSAVYAASKAGLVGFTKAFAKELGQAGVRANVISPGYVDTVMTKDMNEQSREQALRRSPMGRFGTVEEIVSGVEFVLQNEFINGTEIVIDGGVRFG